MSIVFSIFFFFYHYSLFYSYFYVYFINIGAPQNSEKHNKLKNTNFPDNIKRPKNRPESIFFNENECNRRRKTRGIQKKQKV